MKEMAVTLATSVGWVGAVGTVVAYALVSRSRLDAHSLRFQAMNIGGAALLAVSALTSHNWPSMVSNVIWGSIGLHALLMARSYRRAVDETPALREVPEESGSEFVTAA
jgi:hypothetical protein